MTSVFGTCKRPSGDIRILLDRFPPPRIMRSQFITSALTQMGTLPENPRVGGSIPPLATIIHKAFPLIFRVLQVRERLGTPSA